MAEIGVVRALKENGVPIDAVGGTSAGSLVSGTIARGWDPDEMTRELQEVRGGGPRTRSTRPFRSCRSRTGKRITDQLREGRRRPRHGRRLAERLLRLHQPVSGRRRSALARPGVASHPGEGMSIPGVFPPVAINGDVLVDGGPVDNLPIEPMREAHDGIYVIAVDVGGAPGAERRRAARVGGAQWLEGGGRPHRPPPEPAEDPRDRSIASPAPPSAAGKQPR